MHLERQIAIHAPAGAVWRCLTEIELRKRWMSQLVSEEQDGEAERGVGSAATVRLRQNNKIVTYRSTVIDWEPERKLSVGMTGGSLPPELALGVIYELLPGDERGVAILKYDFHMPVKGFFFRLLLPLIRKGIGQVVDQDLAHLKTLAETLTVEPTGA